MERFEIKYLGNILVVDNVDDYHVKGTYDPTASCDIEFFGHRETSFDIVEGWWLLNDSKIKLDEEQLDYYRNNCDNQITYFVQEYLDER